MRFLAVLPVLVVVACGDTETPTEPDAIPPSTTPVFNTTLPGARYTAVDLGTLGGSFSTARDINESGHVVGESTTASGDRRAFLWDGVEMHDLGTLGGSWSSASGINDAGEVAGWSELSPDDPNCEPIALQPSCKHAFLWDGTEMRDLGTLGGPTSEAAAINESGHVAGWSGAEASYGGYFSRPFLWNGVEMIRLPISCDDCPDIEGFAHSINGIGVVVGTVFSDLIGGTSAIVWTEVARQVLTEHAPDLSYHKASAWDINDAGMVVGGVAGYGDPFYGPFKAALWSNGQLQTLGTLGGDGSFAHGINEAGSVVGRSRTASGPEHAFLWDGTTMHDLGTLGGYASRANEISDAGWIVGESETASGQVHATLWRPWTPAEQLAQCADHTLELGARGVLKEGQVLALVRKLDNATRALEEGRTRPAINQLGAFQNQARAFVNGGKLTTEQGDEIIGCAESVIDALR